jgi:hypothetical protein
MVTNIVATKTTTFGGALLIAVGLLGFGVPGFLGMHLTALHNVLLLLSGTVAIYFGLKATPPAARAFCLVFGTLFGLLGLAGFVVGGIANTFTIIPGALVLGTMDHAVHLIVGSIFVAVAWVERAATPALATR